MLRKRAVTIVPLAGFEKIGVPSALAIRNQKLGSEARTTANFLSPFSSCGLPLSCQYCAPLPVPTPAKSSPVLMLKGVPVCICDTAVIVQPPSSLPISRERSLKIGSVADADRHALQHQNGR